MQLPHLASRLYGMPLLLARAKLDVILSVLGDRVSWPELDLASPLAHARPRSDAPAGIAVIPVVGSLVRRTMGLDLASGFTSYAEIAGMVDAALSDSSVEGIVLDIDSSGGEAGGVFELGERIRATDTMKPVWAVASDAAYSAAYAIGCAASRLVISRTGGVGSIGVIAMHVDQTARDAQQGYRYTPITAGEQKNDFSPHEKLTPDAHARLQVEVDRLYGLFVAHVAAMRKLDGDAVRATEAGTYFGEDAVTAGLADAVGSLDAVLSDFSNFLVARRARGHAVSGSTRSLIAPPSTLMENTSMPMTDPVENSLTDDPAELTDPETEKHVTNEAPAAANPAAPEAHRADAVAIAELCQLAGHPELTAAFLAKGVSEAHVRKALLASRADSPEIRSTIAPDAAPPQQSPSANPLMAAVKNLTGKE
ncbi:MAG: S49 family peptidase [Candidatus Dechloromonas phosphoritropha]|jgi:signal peptide peptidase SppA